MQVSPSSLRKILVMPVFTPCQILLLCCKLRLVVYMNVPFTMLLMASTCMYCRPTCEYICVCVYVVLWKACQLPTISTLTSFDFDLNVPYNFVKFC